MRRSILKAAGLIPLATASSGLLAQQAYPSRSIKLVVPFPAGSATDVVSRVLAPELSTALGQQVVVVNSPGADSAIGAGQVARAEPDGYTLLMSTNSFCAVPALHRNPNWDAVADFTPITLYGRYSFFVFVNAKVPVKTFPELMEYARKHPGELSYATGNATGIVATGQIMNLAGGLKMTHVPYKGEPAALLDVAENRVQVMISTATTALPHVKEGKLRMLATTLPQRSPLWPDVPTVAESGLPDFNVPSWAALQGPAKLPKAIVDRLASEVARIVKEPKINEQLVRQQFFTATTTPDELSSYIRAQLDLYAKTLRDAGITPQ